jgi:hypothetical protein
MDQLSSPMPRACCSCQTVIRELQQEVRTLRAELECHVSCEHCGLVYDNRCPVAAEACAATGSATHNDPEFERCEVCQLVVPKATQGFRLGDYLDGVECVHHFHPKAAAVLDEQCLRWPCCGARGAGAKGCASLRFKVHHDVEGLETALRSMQ